jgi:hypothetical protein
MARARERIEERRGWTGATSDILIPALSWSIAHGRIHHNIPRFWLFGLGSYDGAIRIGMCALLCLCRCLKTHTTFGQRLSTHSIGVLDDLPLALTAAPVSTKQPYLSPTTSGSRSTLSGCGTNASWARTTPTHTRSSSHTLRPRTVTPRCVFQLQLAKSNDGGWTNKLMQQGADLLASTATRTPEACQHVAHPNISHLNNRDVGHLEWS